MGTARRDLGRGVIDDRGRWFALAPADRVLDRAMGRVRSPLMRAARTAALMAVAAAVVLLLVWQGWMRPGANGISPVSIMIPIATIAAMACWRAIVAAREAGIPRLPTLAAWCTAQGHCGACGQDLGREALEPDGCAVCPHCGAAWHADRITLRHPDSGRFGVTLFRRAPRSGPSDTFVLGELAEDDRGVPMPTPFKLSRWLRAAPAGAASRVVRAEMSIRRRRAAMAALILVVAWPVAAVGLVFIVGNPLPRDRWNDLLSTLLATGLIGLFGVALFYVCGVSGHRLRPPILAQRRCPACAGELPAASPAAFDGCVACPGCGRAWRLEPRGAS